MILIKLIILQNFVINLINCSILLNGLNRSNFNINYNKIFTNVSCVHFVQITNVSESNSFLADLHCNKNATISVLLINPHHNLSNLDKFNCNCYVIFINSLPDLKNLFTLKIFKNLAKILIILKNLTNFEINSVMNERLRKNLLKKSLNIMWIDYENLLRNNYSHVNDLFGYEGAKAIIDEDKFIDRIIRNENCDINIRVSLFECPPYVIYNGKNNKKIRLDGSEYRSLQTITKNWNTTFTHRDFSITNQDPWKTSLKDLNHNISDLSMCSIWLSEHHYRHYDISEYIDYQCITFLVPKPLILTQASIIYLPYSTTVWIVFYIVMAVTLVLIKLSSWIEIKIHENEFDDNKFNDVSVILLEMTNIMTSHGLVTFPKYLIFKILFMSWILLNFLIAVGYVTGYTSLLTIPRYSKSIDTIKDFLEQDINWSETTDGSYREEFLRTENLDFIKLVDQYVVEKSEEHRFKLLAGHKFSKIVKIISSRFVTDTAQFGSYITEVQPMKMCLFEYYTTFAFPKLSPFKKIFDRQILRIREAGLFKAWFRDIIFRYADEYMKRIFDRHIDSASGTIILTLVHLTGAFYLLCIGLSLAIAAFFGELIWIRVSKIRNN